MKKNQKASTGSVQKILAFVEKNPKCEVKTVIQKTGLGKSTTYKTMQDLRNTGQLEMTNQLYSLATAPAKLVKKVKTVKTTEVVENTKKAEETKVIKMEPNVEATKAETVTKSESADAGKNYGRDFTKLFFLGLEMRKGKCILAIVTDIVRRNPKITFAQLLEIFPNHLVRTFGVVKKIQDARKINSSGKQRYFGRRDQILTLGCGTVVAVTNQISRDNFPGIVAAYEKAIAA